MILHIVGARPNYVKAAPLIREFKARDVKQIVVNTSQHYHDSMSKNIMNAVGMDEPDVFLPVVKECNIKRFSFMIKKIYEIMESYSPDIVIVYGDVDSTLAAALAAKKYGSKLVHVESGLRSFDENMPEEINRRIVDEISDICFVTEDSGIKNLQHCSEKVFMVGNTMKGYWTTMVLIMYY
jgi:UDP-N-acetylglucosamine 2-epimerase (non-hydrolysing)